MHIIYLTTSTEAPLTYIGYMLLSTLSTKSYLERGVHFMLNKMKLFTRAVIIVTFNHFSHMPAVNTSSTFWNQQHCVPAAQLALCNKLRQNICKKEFTTTFYHFTCSKRIITQCKQLSRIGNGSNMK